MPHPQTKIHRMFELVEPIATITFSEVPTEAFLALGMPAEVVLPAVLAYRAIAIWTPVPAGAAAHVEDPLPGLEFQGVDEEVHLLFRARREGAHPGRARRPVGTAQERRHVVEPGSGRCRRGRHSP